VLTNAHRGATWTLQAGSDSAGRSGGNVHPRANAAVTGTGTGNDRSGSATAQSCLIVNVAFSGVSEFDGSFMTRLYDEHG
jgi:hypothetical protein